MGLLKNKKTEINIWKKPPLRFRSGLGESVKIFLDEVGQAGIFTAETIKQSFSFPPEISEFPRQCCLIFVRSFLLVTVAGFIMGLVLAIQSRHILTGFEAAMLPGIVAVSIVCEAGPLITALICAGKMGSGIGAELGLMKVSEQIDAMEVSAGNPMKFLVATRVMACVLVLPLLVIFSDAAGLLGSWLGGDLRGVNTSSFFSGALGSLQFIDFFCSLVKSFAFGAAIGLVGCYKGYNAGKGNESVGAAANSAVVVSSLLIIIIDLLAARITEIIL